MWIYERTGSATQFALNVVAYFVPRVLISPLAGVVADRRDRRIVMLLSDALAALSTLGVLALLAAGQLQVWHIYLATAVNSIASAFQ